MSNEQAVQAPKSSPHMEVEQLAKLELHLITRKADGSPMEGQVAVVPWPA